MTAEDNRNRELQWLAELKVGDEVVDTVGFDPMIRKVASVSPQYVTVGMGRYRRKDGRGAGNCRGAIKMPTPEIRERIERRLLISRFRGMNRVEVEKLSTDQLRRMADIFDEGKVKNG